MLPPSAPRTVFVPTEAAAAASGTVGTCSSVHVPRVLKHSPVVGHPGWSSFCVVSKVLQARSCGASFTLQPVSPSVFLGDCWVGRVSPERPRVHSERGQCPGLSGPSLLPPAREVGSLSSFSSWYSGCAIFARGFVGVCLRFEARVRVLAIVSVHFEVTNVLVLTFFPCFITSLVRQQWPRHC